MSYQQRSKYISTGCRAGRQGMLELDYSISIKYKNSFQAASVRT